MPPFSWVCRCHSQAWAVWWEMESTSLSRQLSPTQSLLASSLPHPVLGLGRPDWKVSKDRARCWFLSQSLTLTEDTAIGGDEQREGNNLGEEYKG